MMDSRTRKIGRIKKDLISELPCNIQETILGFLPIQDAVRTSTLSRKWRHCWTMIPRLIFDDQFLGSMWKKLEQYHDLKLRAYEFVSVINKVLLLHSGPILEVSLMSPEHCDAKVIHDYIYQWIPLFSMKGVKKLNVKNCHWDDFTFTAHRLSSLDLTELRLNAVSFSSTPSFGGFTCLKNLKLFGAIGVKSSILDFPVLEKLTLLYCKGLFPNNFRAPNLKCLNQECPELPLEYSLAGLKNLTEYSCDVHTISMTGAKSFDAVNFLDSLHKIEKLSLGISFVKYLVAGGCPNILSKPMPCLKILNMSGIEFSNLPEVLCLLYLIRSAPKLRELHISANDIEDVVEGNLSNFLAKNCTNCTISHLEIVTFSCLNGLRDELELVKFLLAHSPLLKTMFISRHTFVEMEVALRMAEEMLQYSRASSKAQIRFSEDDDASSKAQIRFSEDDDDIDRF